MDTVPCSAGAGVLPRTIGLHGATWSGGFARTGARPTSSTVVLADPQATSETGEPTQGNHAPVAYTIALTPIALTRAPHTWCLARYLTLPTSPRGRGTSASTSLNQQLHTAVAHKILSLKITLDVDDPPPTGHRQQGTRHPTRLHLGGTILLEMLAYQALIVRDIPATAKLTRNTEQGTARCRYTQGTLPRAPGSGFPLLTTPFVENRLRSLAALY